MAVEINLDGKVSVVTGASSGIGRESAKLLAKAGSNLIINGRNQASLEELANEIKDTKTVVLAGDVRNSKTAEKIYELAKNEFKRLDVLANCAGTTGKDNFAIRLQMSDFTDILDTNLVGTVTMTNTLLPLMTKGKESSIINVSSVVAAMATKTQPAYGTSKGGVEAYTRNIALAFAGRRVRANAIAFGAIDTPMLDEAEKQFPGVKQSYVEKTPLGRLGSVEDAANSVLFLASPLSSFMTGQILDVNGGMYFRT